MMNKPLLRNPVSHYLYFAFVGITVSIAGFFPNYLRPLITDAKEFTSIQHIHGLFGAMWLLLFLLQAWLINTRRHRIHIRLGYAGIFVAVGIVITMQMAAFRFVETELAQGNDATRAILGPFIDSITFAVLFSAAIYYRRRPEVHKRLMLLATILLLWVAWVRLRNYFPPFPGAFNFFGFVLGMMPIPVIWLVEFMKSRKVHPVMLYVGIGVIVEQGIQVLWSETPLWNQTAGAIYKLLSNLVR